METQTTNKIPTFEEIRTAASLINGWKLIAGDRNYFTVENREGYRAYVQLNCWGYEYHNPRYYKSFEFSTVHKPSKKHGSGEGFRELSVTATMPQIIQAINGALLQSQRNIESGRVQMDTRKPSECGRFLQY